MLFHRQLDNSIAEHGFKPASPTTSALTHDDFAKHQKKSKPTEQVKCVLLQLQL